MAGRLAQELRSHSDEQLRGELESAHAELFTLRFQAATRQLADVSKIRKTRRQIARLRTVVLERERGLGHVETIAVAPSAPEAVDEPPADAPAVDEE